MCIRDRPKYISPPVLSPMFFKISVVSITSSLSYLKCMNLPRALCQRNVKNKWKSAGRKGIGGDQKRNRGGTRMRNRKTKAVIAEKNNPDRDVYKRQGLYVRGSDFDQRAFFTVLSEAGLNEKEKEIHENTLQ